MIKIWFLFIEGMMSPDGLSDMINGHLTGTGDKITWIKESVLDFWIQILDVPLSSCLALDKLLSLSKPQFTYLSNRDYAYCC